MVNFPGVLREGENCWRIAKAPRAAFLIDADAYFTAFRHAVSPRARERVHARLGHRQPRPAQPRHRGSAAHAAAVPERRARPPAPLRVFALAWDFSVLFTLEREPSPPTASPGTPTRAWPSGSTTRTRSAGPTTRRSSSSTTRWRSREASISRSGAGTHPRTRRDEPARVDPAGHPYPPAHDIQMMVDGEAAAALGELARARWRAATGEAPLPAARPRPSPRPICGPRLTIPDVRDAPIGIARTMPPFRDAPGVQEIATCAEQAIASARRFIYIENQYLTSAAIGAALARRLAEPAGPEVVVVLPREEHGWLEQSSMGVMRARVLRHLLGADRHGRLRLFFPDIPALEQALHERPRQGHDRRRSLRPRRLREPHQSIDGRRQRMRPRAGRRAGPPPRAHHRRAAEPPARRAPRMRPAGGRRRARRARLADRRRRVAARARALPGAVAAAPGDRRGRRPPRPSRAPRSRRSTSLSSTASPAIPSSRPPIS